MDELRDEIADIISDSVAGNMASDRIADLILAQSEIAEALQELRVRQRVEAHLAGTRDERRFVR